MNYIHLLCCSCKSSITLHPAFPCFPDGRSQPMCKPNRRDPDPQKLSHVSVKEASNFTDISTALAGRSGLPARLHAAPASSSEPGKPSAAIPSPTQQAVPADPRNTEAFASADRAASSAREPPAPHRGGSGARGRERRAGQAPAGSDTAPGEIFQSAPSHAWPQLREECQRGADSRASGCARPYLSAVQ